MDKEIRTFLQRYLALLLTCIGAFLVISLILGYVFGWAWVGVSEYRFYSDGEIVEVQRQKTLWDLLDLLIVPLVIAVGAWWLNNTDKERERALAQERWNREQELAEIRRREEQYLADKRAEVDRELNLDSQRQATLARYFDRMTELMLREGLGNAGEDGHRLVRIRAIARAETLDVLGTLDGSRKAQVVKFLYEADLLDAKHPVISLEGADLSRVDLRNARISGIDLSGANLEESSLANAKLVGGKLAGANLIRADLFGTNFTNADMRHVKLGGAKLTLTTMSGTNLSQAEFLFQDTTIPQLPFIHATLFQVALNNADLTGARLTEEQLQGALSLHGVTMPDGSKHSGYSIG